MTQEALKLVEELNSETWVEGIGEFWKPFKFCAGGYVCWIEFMGEPVWYSDTDNRRYINDDEKEPLIECLIRESKRILLDLNIKMAKL